MVPVMLLDVDGVVNAYESMDDTYRSQIANGYPITWNQTVVDRIHKMHTDGLVEVHWLTTWGALANQHIAPLFGWGEFTVAGEIGTTDWSQQKSSFGTWWKLCHAKEMFENGRRIIWADDDLGYYPEALEWLFSISSDDNAQFTKDFSGFYSPYLNLVNALAICPSPAIGLTHGDLDVVETWL